jgi:hypothetical protein
MCETRTFLAVVFSATALLCACRPPKTGPKLIEADGITYTACGGALWVEDGKVNVRDIDSRSYEVLFTDGRGITHKLKRVRKLKVTDLPSDIPACMTPP